MKRNNQPLTTMRALAFFIFLLTGFGSPSAAEESPGLLRVTSPNDDVAIAFRLTDTGVPLYAVTYKQKSLLQESGLGLRLESGPGFDRGLSILESKLTPHAETWTPIAGERTEIRNHYNELAVILNGKDRAACRLLIKFRAYNEGAAFCYVIPEQENVESFTITGELTRFRFGDDHFCWDTKDPQGLYRRVPISEVGQDCERPLVVEVADGPFVALGEARLVDYARLRFKSIPNANAFGIKLGSNVTAEAPYATPWRYVVIGDTPGELIENNDLIPNLNDPCAINDTSWIKPGKVIRSELNTTAAKATVDWARKIGASYILIDAGWYGPEMDDKSDATTVTVDPRRYSGPLDLQDVIDYGKTYGIGVILYVNRRALERQLDELLPLFRKWGVAGIKFGFVRVGSQEWTTWVHDSVRKCADYKMVVDIHDDYRPTGWSRTYPNLLTQEGIKGNETMPTAEENLILPFTRYLCGPADYTVCYYSPRIKTTRAHQLAASIVYFSPIQLLFWYDGPEQYRGEPELDVFKQLHTTWDDTRVIHGEIGKFITIARRKADQWFVGTMNAGERRRLDIPLTFLKPGVTYAASIHSDSCPQGEAPKEVTNSSQSVTVRTVITADMADNGGQVIILTPYEGHPTPSDLLDGSESGHPPVP